MRKFGYLTQIRDAILKFKFNLFFPFMAMVHFVCYSVTPINNDLYMKTRRGHQLRVRNCDRYWQYQGDFVTKWVAAHEEYNWWRRLAHFGEVINLVKRYHMVGNFFLLITWSQYGYLVHATIKSFIHSVYTGSSKERIEMFNKFYYPHLAGVFPEPYLFNSLTMALNLICFSARSLSLYRLIRGSIINEHGYKEIHVTQINTAALTTSAMTLNQWKTLHRHSVNHSLQLKKSAQARSKHLKLYLAEKLVDQLPLYDLMFNVNAVDFEECYEELGAQYFRCPDNQLSMHQKWYCPSPTLRCTVSILRKGLLSSFIAIICMVGGLLITFAGIIFLELRSRFPADADLSIREVVSPWREHFSVPVHIIRVYEMFLLILTQVPVHFDASVILSDMFIMVSRTNKLRQILLQDIDLQKRQKLTQAIIGKEERTEIVPSLEVTCSRLRSYQYNLNTAKRLSQQSNGSQVRWLINERFKRHIRLIRLVYLEFRDVRKYHTILVNLTTIGHGITLSYIISLFFTVNTRAEQMVLTFAACSSITLTIGTLIICSQIELSVCNLYSRLSYECIPEANRKCPNCSSNECMRQCVGHW